MGQITHGPGTGLVYGEQSVVSDAAGNILVRAADRDREILVIDIPHRGNQKVELSFFAQSP